MGPWSHGGWARTEGEWLGNINFAVKTGEFFRERIQLPFFVQYLKDRPAALPEAYVFLTGANEWRGKDVWPPKEARPLTLYFKAGGRLSTDTPAEEGASGFDEYVSDPNRPVPFVGYVVGGMTSDYMTEDQRFASQRPDVLTYETGPLDEDLVIAGPVKVSLNVSTTGTDSDFVVKVVDVYPADYPQPGVPDGQRPPPNYVRMGGYQQLVRGEPFRAKFREGFERPVALTPGKPAHIEFELPDVYHAFRRGHRVLVQVQSSWFPLVDRNPQKFMEIPKATAADFQKATQRVYRSGGLNSSVTVLVEQGSLRPLQPAR
jgi:putative CocE/NonD family hydrolase